MAKRLRSIPPVIPHYPPENDRGAYAPQLWYGDEAVNAADGPWYDAPPGSIYVQGGTATGALYSKVADTGTAGDWQALGGAGSGTGYNVRDYGATGDGTTDDAAAINAAITAAHAGGGYVYFPAGTYSLGSTLNLIDSTTAATGINRLVGAGVDRTILKLAASANCDVISHTNFATLTGGASRWGLYHTTIESLSIDGNRASNTSGYGIRLYGRGLIVRDVYIHDCSNDGLYTEHGGADDFTAWTGDVESFFVNVKCALNDGNGWTFKGDGDAQVVGFVAYSNGDWGWDVQQSVHATHVNTYLNTSGGIWVNGSGVLDGSNIAATTATGHGLLIDTGTGASIITNLTASGATGVEIRSQNHVITGTIANTTTAALKFGANGKAFVAVSMTLNSGYWLDVDAGGTGSHIVVAANGGVGTLFNGTPANLSLFCSVDVAPTSYSATSYLQLPGARVWTTGGYTYTLPETTGTLATRGAANTFTGIQTIYALTFGGAQALTIADGAVTTNGQNMAAIDTEGGGASDDLNTISGGNTGQLLVITAANSARTVVAKDGTGNLQLAGDCTLDNAQDTLTLLYDGSNWLELSRSDNGS